MLSQRARRGRHRWRWLAGHVRPDLTIRWWHPGFLAALGLALLRQVGVLPHLCRSCGGAGRLVRREKFWRRQACPDCRGTGRTLDDDSMATIINAVVQTVKRMNAGAGLSARKTVQESIAASPAGNHELYPKGSIVVCVSCARPIYRLDRAIFIGERCGRSADAYRPVRVADLTSLRAREDIDAGLRASLQALTTQQLHLLCDRIPELRAGMPCACPLCQQVFVLTRSSADPHEVNETLDRGYVIELVTIPPQGHAATVLSRGATYARRLTGIRTRRDGIRR